MTDLSRPAGTAPARTMGNGLYCWVCGSTPAVYATIRRHQGLLVAMRFSKEQGLFCRDCGMATFRRLQGDSLWQGWWSGLSPLINPIILLGNLGERTMLMALPAPVPGAPYQPLDPGKPLTRRPQIIGMLMPVLMVSSAFLTALLPAVTPTDQQTHAGAATSSAPHRDARVTAHGSLLEVATASPDIQEVMSGDCLRNTREPSEEHLAPELEKVSCGDARASARVLAKTWMSIGDVFCAMHLPETDLVYSIHMTEGALSSGMDELFLCTRMLR